MNPLFSYEGLQQKMRGMESERNLAAQVLDTANMPSDKIDLIKEILLMIRNHTGFEALGIRLQDGKDFPYMVTIGFPEEFIEAEKSLFARNQYGELMRDSKGNPFLECMCGNVISGRVDPKLPFFTECGSFWTNSTTDLLATTSEAERQVRTRNRCHDQGFESIALI
jgi:hypothetical protein